VVITTLKETFDKGGFGNDFPDWALSRIENHLWTDGVGFLKAGCKHHNDKLSLSGLNEERLVEFASLMTYNLVTLTYKCNK